MKYSASGPSSEMASILHVDGYNMIGNWAELVPLKAISLEEEYSWDAPTRQMLDARLDEQTRIALEKLRRGR